MRSMVKLFQSVVYDSSAIKYEMKLISIVLMRNQYHNIGNGKRNAGSD